MSDARYPEGHRPAHAQPTSRIGGILAAIGTMGRAGVALLAVGGAILVVGEVSLPRDHSLRPANIYSAFVGDAGAGVQDRMLATTTRWQIIEQEGIARIERKTEQVRQELQVRADAVNKRIDAVDSSLASDQIPLIVGSIACSYAAIEIGSQQYCNNTKAFRAARMAERDALIGDVKVLQSDREVLDSIGLPDNFMAQFEKN